MNYDDISKTIEYYKANAAQSVLGSLAPDVQKDLQISSQLQAYNLFPTALTIYPVLTPLRNMLPRLQGRGRQAEYKAIVGVSGISLQNAFQAEGNSGALINLNLVDVVSVYKTLKVAGAVSFEQQWAGQGFIDSKATEVVNTLRQLMLIEELGILYAQNSGTQNLSGAFRPGPVGTPTTPTISAITAPSGVTGVGGATTLFVKITGVTGTGESLPSTEVSQALTTGQVARLAFPARGANPVLFWNVYVSTTTNTEHLVRASDNVMFDANTSQAVGSSAGSVVYLNGVGGGAVVPTSDVSASANAYDGLIPQLYASAAAAQGYGPIIQSANNVLTVQGATANALNGFLKAMWDTNRANPDWLLAFSTEAIKITTLTIGSGTPYFIVPEGGMQNATANFRVARFTNPVTGKEVEIKAHPNFSQGMIVAGSDNLPEWYTPSETPAPVALDMVQDYVEVDYPPVYNTGGSGDRWVVQVMNFGTLRLFMPVLFGIMDSISSS